MEQRHVASRSPASRGSAAPWPHSWPTDPSPCPSRPHPREQVTLQQSLSNVKDLAAEAAAAKEEVADAKRKEAKAAANKAKAAQARRPPSLAACGLLSWLQPEARRLVLPAARLGVWLPAALCLWHTPHISAAARCNVFLRCLGRRRLWASAPSRRRRRTGSGGSTWREPWRRWAGVLWTRWALLVVCMECWLVASWVGCVMRYLWGCRGVGLWSAPSWTAVPRPGRCWGERASPGHVGQQGQRQLAARADGRPLPAAAGER